MKIDITSDLHLDMHFNPAKALKKSKLKVFFDKILETRESDILVVSGDLGHYNYQIANIFQYIRDNYYTHIVCVLGNHDYYLLNKTQVQKYNRNSFNRVEELRGMLNSIKGVHCLNGNVVEIDGVRFGGCDSWYDGSYYHTFRSTYGKDIVEYWKRTMNDARKIYGIDDFYDLLSLEKEKLEAIYQKCDVLVTHVSPSIDEDNLSSYKQGDKITAFYTFEGKKFLENTSATHWIFGHMHFAKHYEKFGVKCISSALGYPKQKANYKVSTIEF